MNYNSSNWYWAIGGQIYSSAANAVVLSTNDAYVAWVAAGGVANPNMPSWAALDAELTRIGLPITGQATPTTAQLQSAIFAKVAALLSVSRPYTVAGVTGAISCDCGPSQADVQEALAWGGVPSQTGALSWIDNTYTNFSLTPAEAVTFALAVGTYKQSVYAEAATVNQGVNSGSITTLAQIASTAWPT